MVNNFFPTPIYSNKIDSELLTKIKVNLFEYIKENKDLFKTTQWKCNTKTNIFCEQEREFFPDYLKELNNTIFTAAVSKQFTSQNI